MLTPRYEVLRGGVGGGGGQGGGWLGEGPETLFQHLEVFFESWCGAGIYRVGAESMSVAYTHTTKGSVYTLPRSAQFFPLRPASSVAAVEKRQCPDCGLGLTAPSQSPLSRLSDGSTTS